MAQFMALRRPGAERNHEDPRAKMHLAKEAGALDAEAERAATWQRRGGQDSQPVRLRPSSLTSADALLPSISRELAAERRGGRALPGAVRSWHETRLGYDFSQVRVRDGQRAARLTAGLGAEALTVGRDIVLSSPLTSADRIGLLAHELAHVVQLGGRDGLVLRQARPGAAAPGVATAADRRDVVQSAIRFLESASDYYANVATPPPVERVLRNWQQMIEAQGGVVIDDLGADPVLYQGLRAAYRQALTTLIETAARLTRRPAAALYEQHRALIPEWAFPSQRVPGITADLPTEAQVDRRGRAAFTVGPVDVVVLPDGRATGATKTTISFPPARINASTRDGRVVSFRGPPRPRATIQTAYASGQRAEQRSAYGRGTTVEDVAAGTTSLGFHEGSHARDYLRYLREHPYPHFTGAVGMSGRDFQQAMTDYDAEIKKYLDDMLSNSLQGTDCVGTTIDEDNVRRGGHVVIQCRP